jgi:hypothetical protein
LDENSLIAPPMALRPAALRAAQHFDAVEVHQIEQRTGQRRDIDVIDIDADARFQCEVEVGLADAANEGDQARAILLALRGQRDVGGLRGDLFHAGLAARLQHFGIDRGDRQRRILKLLFAELRGDDDLGIARVIGLRGGILRQRRAGRDRHDQGTGP